MPSPFPGMDPYLEGPLWSDLHSSLIVAIRTEITKFLPDAYDARVGQYLWLEAPDDDDDSSRRLFGGADVHVARPGRRPAAGAAVLDAAPASVEFPELDSTQRCFIRVTDREFSRVVTVVELLSPANKAASRAAYLLKRREYLTSGTNLVEIDLLRDGERLPLGSPDPARTDYYVMVSRAVRYPTVGLWPFGVRDPLPELRVPLDPGVPDVVLDFKAVWDRCYDDARYDKKVRYARPPERPLRPADAAWAETLLAPHRDAPR